MRMKKRTLFHGQAKTDEYRINSPLFSRVLTLANKTVPLTVIYRYKLK